MSDVKVTEKREIIATDEGVAHITTETISMLKESAEKYAELMDAMKLLEAQSTRLMKELDKTNDAMSLIQTQLKMLVYGEPVESIDNPELQEAYGLSF